MQIPSWLKADLTPSDADGVVEAIRQAETTTSGEIVPMVVRRSSTIGHVPVILFALLVALFFGLDGPGWQGEWLGDHWLWYLADTGLLLALTSLGARWPWLQRVLTARADQASQVDARAIIEFYGSNITHTKDATGILIFVSMLERRAVVLADKAIHDKVAADTWAQVCDNLIVGIKTKNLGEALRQAVLACSEIMTPHFPIQPDDVNELKDELIIKE